VKRAGYLAVTLVVAAAGTVATAIGGRPVLSVAVGVSAAWIVQAVSFWVLAGGLERGDRITRVWLAGIAGRFGAGVLVWALAALAGAPTRELMIAYGMALVAFLLLEAGWLAVTTADPRVRRT
jgi:hypothetical protein